MSAHIHHRTVLTGTLAAALRLDHPVLLEVIPEALPEYIPGQLLTRAEAFRVAEVAAPGHNQMTLMAALRGDV